MASHQWRQSIFGRGRRTKEGQKEGPKAPSEARERRGRESAPESCSEESGEGRVRPPQCGGPEAVPHQNEILDANVYILVLLTPFTIFGHFGGGEKIFSPRDFYRDRLPTHLLLIAGS